jgi:hypothetical protein
MSGDDPEPARIFRSGETPPGCSLSFRALEFVNTVANAFGESATLSDADWTALEQARNSLMPEIHDLVHAFERALIGSSTCPACAARHRPH